MPTYSEKVKAEIIAEVIADGRTLRDVAISHNMSRTTLNKWINEYKESIKKKNADANNDVDNSVQDNVQQTTKNGLSTPACERVEEVLKKMERHQIELEQLAYEELLKKLSTARASEIVNLLNITTNQYKSGNGKPTDVIAVKTWDSFLDDID